MAMVTLETVTLEHSQEVLRVHPEALCAYKLWQAEGYCAIHKRSEHVMRAFPQHWRWDRGIMERICTHGVGHPDPDDWAIQLAHDRGQHGCDGCCGFEVPTYLEHRRARKLAGKGE